MRQEIQEEIQEKKSIVCDMSASLCGSQLGKKKDATGHDTYGNAQIENID